MVSTTRTCDGVGHSRGSRVAPAGQFPRSLQASSTDLAQAGEQLQEILPELVEQVRARIGRELYRPTDIAEQLVVEREFDAARRPSSSKKAYRPLRRTIGRHQFADGLEHSSKLAVVLLLEGVELS